jgi:Escherichia/Staphylococcus phage prohead protease
MSEMMVRTFTLDVLEREAAADGSPGRVIDARCVPYNVETMVRDPGGEPYLEVFHLGAFRKAMRAPNRVAFRYRHQQGLADELGRAVSFAEQDDGLHGVFSVIRSAFGDHALALVDEGIVGGVSIGYAPLTKRAKFTPSGAIIRDACHLEEVSLVPTPAYETAVVTGRREAFEKGASWGDDEWLVAHREKHEAQSERLRALGLM